MLKTIISGTRNNCRWRFLISFGWVEKAEKSYYYGHNSNRKTPIFPNRLQPTLLIINLRYFVETIGKCASWCRANRMALVLSTVFSLFTTSSLGYCHCFCLNLMSLRFFPSSFPFPSPRSFKAL